MKKRTNETAPGTLNALPAGLDARVTHVHGTSRVSKRLMEMGVVPGASIRVIKSAPFGDPIEVRVQGYRLAMRRSEAAEVEVSV